MIDEASQATLDARDFLEDEWGFIAGLADDAGFELEAAFDLRTSPELDRLESRMGPISIQMHMEFLEDAGLG